MEPADVRSLYGGTYAERYDEIWPESDAWSTEAGHHVRTLAELVTPGTRWLDVGCGTGYFLSRFPGVERVGLDLSPDMLAQARLANPDAEFHEGDLRDDVPAWHDRWDLVTCTGQPWSYVATMDEIDRVVANLAAWTAPGGRCFLTMSDLADLTGLEAPYPALGEAPPVALVTGTLWSLQDAGGHHRHMIAPAVGYWIEAFARHFRQLDVLRWPHEPSFIPIARRNLLASAKRGDGDEAPAEVTWHPIPPARDPGPPRPGPVEPDPAATAVDAVAARDDAPVEAVPAPTDPAPTGPSSPAPSRHHAEPGLPPGRLPGRGLYDQPLSYLVGRFAPWKPAFWRSAARRAAARRR